MTDQKTSLFEKIGGAARVDVMVQAFYERVLRDPELEPFFVNADVARLTRMQQEFFSVGLDGPIEFSSRRLFATHHGRGISRKHFTKFCDHLLATLLDHGLNPEDADQVIIKLSMYAGHITGEGGVDG
jgi:hemoglobin